MRLKAGTDVYEVRHRDRCVFGQGRLRLFLPHLQHTLELGKGIGTIQCLCFGIVVVEPRITRLGVFLRRWWLGWRVLTGDRLPGRGIYQVDEASAAVLRIPIMD